jgi:outer membrane protein assembly factor BamD (BamD/ComL family)
MIFGGASPKEKIMTKRFCFFFLFFLIFLSHTPFTLSDQIVIDSEDQYRFAQAALDKGEYLRAIAEFERFVHFFPRDDRVPEARYRIGLCYIMAKDYDSGRGVLEDVYTDYSSAPGGGKALFLIGESYFQEGLTEEAEHYFRKVVEAYTDLELKNRALYRLGWNWMKQDKWGEASEAFMKVEQESPLYAHSRELSRMSLNGEALPRKNPTAAGILSGILPGLGHAYCERYKDGAVALLLNGLTIWASLEAFNEDLDVLGGALMFLELGWYTGTIYSAVNSAHKYNRKVRNDFRRNLPDRIDIGLFSTAEGSMGVALKMDF